MSDYPEDSLTCGDPSDASIYIDCGHSTPLKNCHRSYPSTAFVMFASRVELDRGLFRNGAAVWARESQTDETMREVPSKAEWKRTVESLGSVGRG